MGRSRTRKSTPHPQRTPARSPSWAPSDPSRSSDSTHPAAARHTDTPSRNHRKPSTLRLRDRHVQHHRRQHPAGTPPRPATGNSVAAPAHAPHPANSHPPSTPPPRLQQPRRTNDTNPAPAGNIPPRRRQMASPQREQHTYHPRPPSRSPQFDTVSPATKFRFDAIRPRLTTRIHRHKPTQPPAPSPSRSTPPPPHPTRHPPTTHHRQLHLRPRSDATHPREHTIHRRRHPPASPTTAPAPTTRTRPRPGNSRSRRRQMVVAAT